MGLGARLDADRERDLVADVDADANAATPARPGNGSGANDTPAERTGHCMRVLRSQRGVGVMITTPTATRKTPRTMKSNVISGLPRPGGRRSSGHRRGSGTS